MANEAVLVQQLEDRLLQLTFSGAGTTGLSGGTLLVLTDPSTCTASSGVVAQPFAGISATEKDSADVATNRRIAVWRRGVFDLTVCVGGVVSAGDVVVLSGANLISSGGNETGALSGGHIVGVALQDGAASEVIEVLVGG